MHVAYFSEWIVIVGFVGLFLALYGAAAFLLLRRFFTRFGEPPPLGLTGKLVLAGALLGLIGAAYSFYEPYTLEVTHVRIPIAGLPPSACPIRIVQVSDLHSDALMRLEERIPLEAKKERPDLILFTGDACNSAAGFPNFYKCVKGLEEVAPLYAVKGDWDFIGNFDPLKRAGLQGPNRIINIRGAKIYLAGTDCGASCADALKSAPKNMPLIMMYHGPSSDVIVDGNTEGIDLYVCGHTHGGQIALPFYGALITQSATKRQYASGLNRLGNTWIYTNRGIGMEGHFPRVRFWCKPELTVFDLVPGEKQPPAVTPDELRALMQSTDK